MAAAAAGQARARGRGRDREAIAGALNERDVEATLRLIDAAAVGRAVVKEMGLNAADRETVLKVFPNALRTNIDLGIRTIAGSKGSAKYLRSGQRNGRPFALLRYDLGDQGIDYVEYYLGKTDKVEDWYVHSMATLFSTSARLGLSSLLKTDSMLFALFGTRLTTRPTPGRSSICAASCRSRTSPRPTARSSASRKISARRASGR